LQKENPPEIKFTAIDDEIYTEYRSLFPDMPINDIREMVSFKFSLQEKWRNFIMKYEKMVEDYNFGTMLRNRVGEDYGATNAFFVTRFQFICIELARNREVQMKLH
jgi:Polysaccharide biosynthesis